MSKIELKLKPKSQETKMEVELSDLGFTKEEWNNLRESAKERILNQYLCTYQPEEESYWVFDEWTPKY